MNKFKLLATPFFVICALVGVCFLETLIVPKYHFDYQGLIRIVIILISCSLSGVFLWIIGTEYEKRERVFSNLLMVASIIYVVCLFCVLFGSVDVTRRNASIHSYSLVPFKTMKEYVHAYRNGMIGKAIVYENIIGNLFLFSPMGFIAPYFLSGLRDKKWFCLIGIIFLCAVEFLQFLTSRGSMDIDDVILNFTGAFIFFLLFWNRRMRQKMSDFGIIDELYF